jgi:hypothetical protein
MEIAIDDNAVQEDWSKEELQLFLALAIQGKGRHEIAEIMNLPFSDVVRVALKYSIILPT